MNKILRTLAVGALISCSFAMQNETEKPFKTKVTTDKGYFIQYEDIVTVKLKGPVSMGGISCGGDFNMTSKNINFMGMLALNISQTSEEFLTAIKNVFPNATLEKK